MGRAKENAPAIGLNAQSVMRSFCVMIPTVNSINVTLWLSCWLVRHRHVLLLTEFHGLIEKGFWRKTSYVRVRIQIILCAKNDVLVSFFAFPVWNRRRIGPEVKQGGIHISLMLGKRIRQIAFLNGDQ